VTGSGRRSQHNSVRECQVNVLRVAKSSMNLKGTCQRDLKIAAATTLGMLEVLRTRADRTATKANSEEIKILKKEFQIARDSMTKEMGSPKREYEEGPDQSRL